MNIPAAWQGKIRKIDQHYPWRWLYRIEADKNDSVRTVFQIHAGQEQVTFGSATWYPVPMEQGELVQSGDGALPSLVLNISNVAGTLAPYFHVGEGFMGRPVEVYLVNLEDTTDFLKHDMVVAGAALTATTAALLLEMPNLLQRLVPFDRYHPQRCRWGFGSRECGYVINEFAAFTTCNKSLSDCVARGDDMAARNLPRTQPARFGAFAGIPVSA